MLLVDWHRLSDEQKKERMIQEAARELRRKQMIVEIARERLVRKRAAPAELSRTKGFMKRQKQASSSGPQTFEGVFAEGSSTEGYVIAGDKRYITFPRCCRGKMPKEGTNVSFDAAIGKDGLLRANRVVENKKVSQPPVCVSDSDSETMVNTLDDGYSVSSGENTGEPLVSMLDDESSSDSESKSNAGEPSHWAWNTCLLQRVSKLANVGEETVEAVQHACKVVAAWMSVDEATVKRVVQAVFLAEGQRMECWESVKMRIEDRLSKKRAKAENKSLLYPNGCGENEVDCTGLFLQRDVEERQRLAK